MKKLMAIGAAVCMSIAAMAQTSEGNYEARTDARVGNMSVSDFVQLNERGAQMVNKIRPDKKQLSAADQQLFIQVANGGMRQLMLSQAVLGKATDEQVRLLAQSEVEEQTTVAAKLQQIATAKGLTVPERPDAETETLVSSIGEMSADEVNAFYIRESGVKGHELLRETMTTVKANAKDRSLRALANATLPVIETHLQVSQAVHAAKENN
jgi:putative membrane protein